LNVFKDLPNLSKRQTKRISPSLKYSKALSNPGLAAFAPLILPRNAEKGIDFQFITNYI